MTSTSRKVQPNGVGNRAADASSDFQTKNSVTSRREFLGKAGLLTAAGVMAPGLASAHGITNLAASEELNEFQGHDYSRPEDDPLHTLHAKSLRKKSYKARIKSAQEEYNQPIPRHPNNGDEVRYFDQNKISISTKGLKHDAEGHVEPASFESLWTALHTRVRSQLL